MLQGWWCDITVVGGCEITGVGAWVVLQGCGCVTLWGGQGVMLQGWCAGGGDVTGVCVCVCVKLQGWVGVMLQGCVCVMLWGGGMLQGVCV